MKKFYLKSKNGVPNEVVQLDNLTIANTNLEPLSEYEAFKIYDSGVVKFSPMAEYAITNLMSAPAYKEEKQYTGVAMNKDGSIGVRYVEKAA